MKHEAAPLGDAGEIPIAAEEPLFVYSLEMGYIQDTSEEFVKKLPRDELASSFQQQNYKYADAIEYGDRAEAAKHIPLIDVLGAELGRRVRAEHLAEIDAHAFESHRTRIGRAIARVIGRIGS